MIRSQAKANLGLLARWFGWPFLALFLFRLAYGFFVHSENERASGGADFFSSGISIRKNYASEKGKMAQPSGGQQNFSAGQKYEKTATVQSKTEDFDGDEKRLRGAAKSFASIIQYEQNLGNRGARELHLLIGVQPELFDSFCIEIKKIGAIGSQQVVKTDKTNEFRELNAKKASLEKTLASLGELKNRSGAVGDFIGLHDKILEIESKLQDLGVELGNFDAENEFCSVRFSLFEGQPKGKISVLHRVKVALEWTFQYYLMLIFGACGALFAAFLAGLVAEKLGFLSKEN